MRRGLALGMLAGLWLISTGFAAPPGKSSPALEKAVAELKAEYAAHLKDAKSTPLRKACNYFADAAAAGVSPDAVLAVLEKALPGTDARQGAYVKWQLLSALPKSPDAATVERLLRIYQRAPLPSPRYGSGAREKRELDKLIPGSRPQDDVQLTARLEEAVARAYALDKPITAFRDELYDRLPVGRERFLAGMLDAEQRLGVGGAKEWIGETMAAELKQWVSDASADPAHVREVAEAFGRLRLVETPPYYGSAGVRRGRLTWVTETDTLISKRRMTTLHKTLLEAAARPSLAGAPPPPARGPLNGKN